VLWHIVRTSLGGVGQMIVAMTAWIFLMRILASIGSEAVAGATIAIRIMMFTMMPAWGMSNAATPWSDRTSARNKRERAEASVWQIGWYNMAYLLAVSVLFFLFRTQPDRLLHRRRACHRHRGGVAAHPVVFILRVRLVDGQRAGLQRRRRH
jgi:Na+-driven multidrug efflux pump